MPAPTRYDEALAALRRLVDSERRSLAAMERRQALPAGSSRARVTTANANWTNAAESRDRAIDDAIEAIRRAGLTPD